MTPQGSNAQSSAHKFHFHLGEVFPLDNPLSVPLIRLMMAANDVRHIQKILLSTGERIGQGTDFDSVVINGEMLHFHRLLCGHLYEAGNAFRAIDAPHPVLAAAAVQGTEYEEALQRLREAYASDPSGAFHRIFLKEVRDQFGFHYKHEAIQAKLQDFVQCGNLDGTVIVAEYSGLSRYVIADHLSIGILQDLLDAELPDMHDAFGEVMKKALVLAGDLGDVVDLLLLSILEQNDSVITKREQGLLSVQPELMTARHKVDELRTSFGSTENGEQRENEP